MRQKKLQKKISEKALVTLSLFFLIISTTWAISPLEESLSKEEHTTPQKATLKVSTPSFNLELREASQTAYALHPASEPGFDFTTGEWEQKRNGDGYYQLGDITFRTRTTGDTAWKNYSTAAKRSPVSAVKNLSQNTLAAANLAGTLPDDIPLEVIRYWENDNGKLVLRFELKNKQQKNIEIGALGIPMIFNNILNEKHLDEVHAENVFFDPYIGMDAGYLQAVRLNGEGPALLVLPHGKTPFEAYRPLLDDPMPQGITFEGFHEWMVHSKAWAENEWKGVDEWNQPTSVTLKPGENYSIGVEFVLTDNVQNIEASLIQHHRPVAVGFPGYVLPLDVDGKLFLKYDKTVRDIKVSPQGALNISKNTTTSHGWIEYQVKGQQWGRARISITYEDGSCQTINYKVIKPESELVADNGRFLTHEQWFEDPNDLFDRSPAVITFDYETKKQVTQDSRSWIAGLSDEGGAGAWLNAIMKQFIQPDPEEVRKIENFVNQTMWGGIQYSAGEHKYGVRKSMFYYQPDSMPAGTYSKDINYKTWAAWSKEAAESVGRSYNYPHVTAIHWVMYRLARNYQGLVTQRSWEWYLENAFHTAIAMVEQAPYYAQFGQMEGTVFLLVLEDLKREGMDDLAGQLETAMKKRAEHWASLNYPFGSEMPWDSTGQEEVYMWSKYFGFDAKATITLKAILAYMPTIPHWAYNGCARRYWDFLFGGKLSRIERMIHHYGSALNAIPVLDAYKETPDNIYLLRVGYGGLMGAVSNITRDGFAPCAFHSFPSTLKNDGISGDYGTGFFGYAVNTSSFLVHHKEFGWLALGGNLKNKGNWIKMNLTTAAKSRVFIAPEGLELSLDAGNFQSVSYNTKSGDVRIEIAPKNSFTNTALLQIGAEKNVDKPSYKLAGLSQDQRGLYEIPLKKKSLILNIQKNLK